MAIRDSFAWLPVVVATQSMAILGALLAAHIDPPVRLHAIVALVLLSS